MTAVYDRTLNIAWIIGPCIAGGFGLVGLFFQINSIQETISSKIASVDAKASMTYLSLREHLEYQNATRRELDAAKTAADQQISNLQKQMDVVTGLLRSQMEDKIKDLQLQIDTIRKERNK